MKNSKSRFPGRFVILLGLLAPLTTSQAGTVEAGLIAAGTAMFIPEGTDSRTLPSLALLEDEKINYPLPDDWDLNPVFSSTGQVFQTYLPIPAGTDLYGSGEVVGPLRRNLQSIELWNTDNYGYFKEDGRRLYQSHPWVLGVYPDGGSFGVIFDTTWRANLDLGEDWIQFSAEGAPYRVIVIEKSSPQEVLKSLAELTGFMPLPPKWALGFHQCKYSYFPDEKVREIADEFRRRQIPCDGIWVDIDYMDGFRIFTFDSERFPDPRATNQYLHDHGFKSVWMINPGVKADSGFRLYRIGSASDYWVEDSLGFPYTGRVWPGDCVFPDFTMPEVRDWWASLYPPFMRMGIDGVWNDMNEPSVFDGPDGSMPESNYHRGGGSLPSDTHARYHNIYGMLMVQASRMGILAANPDKRPFVLTRSNFLGGQRYAATWTGDNRGTWEHLKMSVPMSINLGLSGQPFSGPDIGGFTGAPSADLFGHWIALGAFYPFSRAHADNVSEGNEPWRYGSSIEDVSRTALSRRYRLLPYLYTKIEAATRTGVPVMQPLFFHDPSDLSLRREEEVFLFGEDLLVVPLWAKNPELPDGQWLELQLLDDDVENDGYQPQIFLRPGAIVPTGERVMHTGESSGKPVTMQISLDERGRAAGVLYEDAGDGFDFQDGAYRRLHLQAVEEKGSVQIFIASCEGNWGKPTDRFIIRIHKDSRIVEGRGRLDVGLHVSLHKPIRVLGHTQAYHSTLGTYWAISSDKNHDDWVYSDVFGFIHFDAHPWIWCAGLRKWIYVVANTEGIMAYHWIWIPSPANSKAGEWYYTHETMEGWFYSAQSGGRVGNFTDGATVSGGN